MLDYKEKSEIYLIHFSDMPYLVQKSSIYRKINHITDFLNCTSLLSAIKSICAALRNASSLRLHEQLLWMASYNVGGAFKRYRDLGSTSLFYTLQVLD